MPYGKGIPAWVPTSTWQPDPIVEKVIASYGASSVVVDLGAGRRRLAPHVKTIEFREVKGTDIVCTGTNTPFGNDCVDLVLTTGLIEHVEDDDAVFIEMRRILNPGGIAQWTLISGPAA